MSRIDTAAVIRIAYAKTSLCRETGFRAEIQAFEHGKSLDEAELTHETKKEVADRYRDRYPDHKIRINNVDY